jgi:arylsulfatase A-like enzyme/4-amino-4-deoxy-L-arabinose transferase-like glycosyltransferase
VPLRVRRSVLAVVLVALVVRLAALWAGSEARLVLDEQGYANRALALLEGQGVQGSYQSWVLHDDPAIRPVDYPQYPGAWQPPGQIAFMAAVMALPGGGLGLVKIAQVLLGALSVWLVYALGRAWIGHREGLLAAWICALYPNLVAFTHYLWSETLFSFLLLAALFCLTRREDPPRLGDAALAGLLLGLAALTRATLFYVLLVLPFWLAWAHRRAWRPALAAGALVALVATLVIVPWSLRNTRLHGGFVWIETNSSYNLWRGNGPDSFARRGDPALARYRPPFENVPLAPVGSRAAGRLVAEAKRNLGKDRPTDLEIVDYARSSAWEEIRAEPVRFLNRIPTRLFDMWNSTSFLIRHLDLGAYGDPPPALVSVLRLASAGAYLALLALAAVGAWLERRRPETWLILLLVGLWSGVSAVSFGLTRFRLPLMPLLAILAAAAVFQLRERFGARASGATASALLVLALHTGCGERESRPTPPEGPNILWVVWDTVRADRMSLYGHDRPTTPRLDAWAKQALVFDDTLSIAGYTLPSHASMFTGLLPSEHCTHNNHHRLEDGYVTLAELLRAAGYRTYLFSANPQISESPKRNFSQGFELAEHPWSPRWSERALALVREKLAPEDNSNELAERLDGAARGEQEPSAWHIKAAGELAEEALLGWLDSGEPGRPWFAFVNYMEAHRPLIPPRRYRELFMQPEDVERSYQVDRRWLPMWEYTFGQREYDEKELELTRATYDAALRQLDDLFASLLEGLAAAGHLDNTVVLLTSDHGEHLGEQHMLDHQYSIYQALLRVPLVLYAPGRVLPGRDSRPAANFDVFPSLLELAGVAPPPELRSRARSLLAAPSERLRFAEEPAFSSIGIRNVLQAHPGWDPRPFQRRLRALIEKDRKLLWGSDGRVALYDLERDPLETHDLAADEPATTARMQAALGVYYAGLAHCDPSQRAEVPEVTSPEERRMLEALGYLEAEQASDE